MENKYQESLDMYHRVAEGRSIIIDDRTHYDRLQKLVDKEKAMAVCGDCDDHMCPKCNEYFCICEFQNKINYCPNCGQKLDWSK